MTSGTRLARWLGQRCCGLFGHSTLLAFGDRRIEHVCQRCGFATPGWDLNQAPPRQRFAGDVSRHTLYNPRLDKKPATVRRFGRRTG